MYWDWLNKCDKAQVANLRQRGDRLEYLDLKSFNNYSELTDVMDKISCDGKTPVLKFSDQKSNYNVMGSIACSNSNVVGCYFRRNFFMIANDSVKTLHAEDNRSINELDDVLQDIVSRPYNFIHNDPGTVRPGLIYFYIDPKYPIEKTKNVLITICNAFDNINVQNDINFSFDILFKRQEWRRPPPPPPPSPPSGH